MAISMQIQKIDFFIYQSTRVYDFYDKYIRYEFMRRVAERFRRYLSQVIVAQEFNYPKLSEKYAEWKQLHGLPDNFWIQYGILKKSFLIKRTDKGYSVTLSDALPNKHLSIFDLPGKKTTGKATPIPISEYGYYMEYGRGQSGTFKAQPPRPLIRPAYLQFKKDVYPDMLEKEKQKFKYIWK